MSDKQNWQFSVGDVGESEQSGANNSNEEEADGQTQTIQVDSSSQSRQVVSIISFFLLPISTVSVYTVLKEGAVLSMLTSILGESTVALVATKAFWVIGLGVLGTLSVATIIILLNILLIVTSNASQTNYTVALVGTIFYTLATASTLTTFSTLPFVVGFVLALHLISASVTIAIMLIAVIYATFMA